MTSAAWELVTEMLQAVAFLLLVAVVWAQGQTIRTLKVRVKRIDENLARAREAADKVMERMNEP